MGDVLHDHDLAEAIVDRTLERGGLPVLDGPSHRTLDSKAVQAHAEPDKVFGTSKGKETWGFSSLPIEYVQ